MIKYQQELSLTAEAFIDLLERSTLGERRPIQYPKVIEGMLRCSDVLITARDENDLLVGVSRAISDFHYATYLSDLAVDESFQKQGIGKRLIEETHLLAGLHTRLILLAAPKARDYYPHIGMEPHDSCWMIAPQPYSEEYQ